MEKKFCAIARFPYTPRRIKMPELAKSLRDKTVDLLKSSEEDRQDIAINIGVSKSWITNFAKGHIDGPDVCKVQSLYEYLTKNKLKV